MKLRQQQQGMSVPGMIVIALMVGFFVMCGIRMLPIYFEFLSVKDIVESIVEDYDPDNGSVAGIKRRLSAQFNTNQIYELQPRDVEVFRKDGKTHIDATYEVRIEIFGRFDAVMKFDDLVYIAGEPLPED
jgi:Domain of unknown function (DUF4845)